MPLLSPTSRYHPPNSTAPWSPCRSGQLGYFFQLSHSSKQSPHSTCVVRPLHLIIFNELLRTGAFPSCLSVTVALYLQSRHTLDPLCLPASLPCPWIRSLSRNSCALLLADLLTPHQQPSPPATKASPNHRKQTRAPSRYLLPKW